MKRACRLQPLGYNNRKYVTLSKLSTNLASCYKLHREPLIEQRTAETSDLGFDTQGVGNTTSNSAEFLLAAIELNQWKTASSVVRHILESKMPIKTEWLKSETLRTAIINYYVKSGQIKKGLQFMDDLVSMYGENVLSDAIFSNLLSGIASAIRGGDVYLIQTAEMLFQKALHTLKQSPSASVFGAVATCYCFVPNAAACLDLLKTMIQKKEWPDPHDLLYGLCLNALVQHYRDPMAYEEGWKYVDEILTLMKANNVHIDNAIYSCLFRLCGGAFCNQSNLQKLHFFYDELEQNGIKLRRLTANSLLFSGVDHFCLKASQNPEDIEEIHQDLLKYIDWAMLQFKKYNLAFTRVQNERLQRKLVELGLTEKTANLKL